MRAVERADLELSDDYSIALSKFRFALEERHVSKYTLKVYMAGAERFLRFLQHDMGLVLPLDKLTKEYAREWLRSLRQSGLKPATIRSHYQSARQFFKAAIEDGEIPGGENPFDGLRLPPVELKEITILSPEDVQAMVSAAGRDKTTRRFWGTRDQALITTLYDVGLRASEII